MTYRRGKGASEEDQRTKVKEEVKGREVKCSRRQKEESCSHIAIELRTSPTSARKED